jgi:hypothetical protein
MFLGAFPALRAGNRAIRLYLLTPAASKGYRFYPLRGRKPSAFAFSKPLRGFDFAEFRFAKLLDIFWWSLGLRPKLRKPKRFAFWFPLCGKNRVRRLGGKLTVHDSIYLCACPR